MPATVRHLWPLLLVQNINRSIEFYRDLLGFNLVGQADSGGQVFWCRLERGGASVMLQQAEAEDGSLDGRGRGISFYFVCNDVDAVFAEFSSRGLQLQPPSVAYYGMKQLQVPEPDGYSIWFESPTEDGKG